MTVQFSEFQIDQIKRFARACEHIKHDTLLRFGRRNVLNNALSSAMMNNELPDASPARIGIITDFFQDLSAFSVKSRTVTKLTLIGLTMGVGMGKYAWNAGGWLWGFAVIIGSAVGLFFVGSLYGNRVLTPIWKRAGLNESEMFFALHKVVADPRWQAGLHRRSSKSKEEALMDAAELILAGTHNRLKFRFSSRHGDDFAGFLAAAMLNKMRSQTPNLPRAVAFAETNAALIDQELETIKQDMELRIAMTHAMRAYAAFNYSVDNHVFQELENFKNLGLLVADLPIPLDKEFLSFAENYHRRNSRTKIGSV